MTLDDVRFLLANVKGPLVRVSPAGGRASESGGHWGRARLMGVNGTMAMIQPMGHQKIEYVAPQYLNNWKSKNGVEVPSSHPEAKYLEAEKLWHEKKTMHEMAKITGISAASLSHYFVSKGMRRNSPRTVTNLPIEEPKTPLGEALEAAPIMPAPLPPPPKPPEPIKVAATTTCSEVTSFKAAIRAILAAPIDETAKLLALDAMSV